MNDANLIKNYLFVIDTYKNDFRRMELELFKMGGGTAPRHIIFREAYFQHVIDKYEYDAAMEWEDRYRDGDYDALIRSMRNNNKPATLPSWRSDAEGYKHYSWMHDNNNNPD